MNEFNRTELKLILEGLDAVRNRMRTELLAETPGPDNLLDVNEYNQVVRLQDRIIEALESRFY